MKHTWNQNQTRLGLMILIEQNGDTRLTFNPPPKGTSRAIHHPKAKGGWALWRPQETEFKDGRPPGRPWWILGLGGQGGPGDSGGHSGSEDSGGHGGSWNSGGHGRSRDWGGRGEFASEAGAILPPNKFIGGSRG